MTTNGTVTYSIVVENTGGKELTNFQVTDSLPFAVGEYTVSNVSASVTSGTITANAGYDGSTDTDLLEGTDSLAAGATATITITIDLSDATPGTYDNTAVASTDELGNVDDDGTLADDPGTPGAGTDPEDDEDVTIIAAPDLGLAKTNGVTDVPAGGTTTYTVDGFQYGRS